MNIHPKALTNLMQGLVESDHELFEMERREKRHHASNSNNSTHNKGTGTGGGYGSGYNNNLNNNSITGSPSTLMRNTGSVVKASSRDQSRERERERLTERLRQDREALAQSASYLLGNESKFSAYLSPIRPVKTTVASTHSLYPLETVSGTGTSSLRVSRTSALNNLTQKKLSK